MLVSILSPVLRRTRHLHDVAKACTLLHYRSVSTISSHISDVRSKYDAIIVGAGHNGLISAAYLAKHGLNVAVFERRHVIGGAAVTEEIVPGFKFSRASYVYSLMRPQIVDELQLKKHGLKIFLRTTGAFTPMLEDGFSGQPPRSLCLYPDERKNEEEISKFSKKDAKNYTAYEDYITKIATAVTPLLDYEPPDFRGSLLKSLRSSLVIHKSLKHLDDIPSFYEFVTSPISKVLDRWFETDVLKATLATDGVIGAMISPETPGSSYVLLHHMIGEVEGIKGAWGFVQGGMGAVSNAIASAAKEQGVDIFVNEAITEINAESGKCSGVTLEDGKFIQSDIVLSNATPKVTIEKLLRNHTSSLPEDYLSQVTGIDYTSPVTKINVAVDQIPNFLAAPNKRNNEVGHHHKGTIHLNCENVGLLHDAYVDATHGKFPNRPMIEMCIPSSVDPTLAPPGHHVISLFTQYTPYYLNGSDEWTNKDREKYRDAVFNSIEDYAPGFKNSVIDSEVLTPMDIENIFGLTGGNIFHGAMSLDQLYVARPTAFMSSQRTPLEGLYICGSGTHPGGGVMGACGRLAALAVLSDLKIRKKMRS